MIPGAPKQAVAFKMTKERTPNHLKPIKNHSTRQLRQQQSKSAPPKRASLSHMRRAAAVWLPEQAPTVVTTNESPKHRKNSSIARMLDLPGTFGKGAADTNNLNK